MADSLNLPLGVDTRAFQFACIEITQSPRMESNKCRIPQQTNAVDCGPYALLFLKLGGQQFWGSEQSDQLRAWLAGLLLEE